MPRPPPVAAAPATDVVDWAEVTLTERCNQRCFFCYEDARDVARDPDLEGVKRLLGETHRRAEQVVLCGKEVLLRPDVLEIVAHAASLGLRVVVFTNGQALARPGLVERLADAGCTSLAVSFHFPDPETFARGTRTSPRGFARQLEGLARVARYNGARPDRPLGLSTETDMSALNAGRLAEMRATLVGVLGVEGWSMRVASLLPTRTHDIGLGHAQAPLGALRDEIAGFLASHPGALPLRFVKTPLCLLPPGEEHRSLEIEYVHRGTSLTLNHGEPDRISADALTPSAGRDVGRVLAGHPYRWVCRPCPLAAICRFERVDWHHRFFEPDRLQKPSPRATSAGEVVSRLGADPRAAARVAALERLVPVRPYPEEEIVAALAAGAAPGVTLVEAHADREPLLALDLSCRGEIVPLHLRPPPGASAGLLGFVVDYLDVRPARGASPVDAPLRASLRALAGLTLPEPARWEGTVGFDEAAAHRLRLAWRRFGERLWPGAEAAEGWRVRGTSIARDGSLRIEVGRPPGRAVLAWDVDGERGEHAVASVDARGPRALPEGEYDVLLSALREWTTGIRLEVRFVRGPLPPVRGAPARPAPGAGEMRVEIRDRVASAVHSFRIGLHGPGTPCFRSTGGLALAHAGKQLGPRGEACAEILLGAMQELGPQALGTGCETLWSAALARRLERAGAAAEYAATFRWSEGRGE